jgi:hypothetical protein
MRLPADCVDLGELTEMPELAPEAVCSGESVYSRMRRRQSQTDEKSLGLGD